MNIINLVCGLMASTGVPDTALASWVAPLSHCWYVFSLVPRLSVGGGKRVRVTAYQEPGYEASMCLPALPTNKHPETGNRVLAQGSH